MQICLFYPPIVLRSRLLRQIIREKSQFYPLAKHPLSKYQADKNANFVILSVYLNRIKFKQADKMSKSVILSARGPNAGNKTADKMAKPVILSA